MLNYAAIKAHCQAHSAEFNPIIDKFLIYYAADRENFPKEMDALLKKYNANKLNIEESYINFMKSEFIAHRIFRNGGLISKYLQHAQIKKLPAHEYQKLQAQVANPFRFSFSIILNKPSPDFYEMEDIFTGEHYLLHSPGTTRTFTTQNPMLWFNLIGFNGECYETFGLISGFNAFSEDDIFFFATELNPSIQDVDDLLQEIDRNPFPFMLLISGATIPRLFSLNYEIAYCISQDNVKQLDTQLLRTSFTIGWNNDIFKLALNQWDENPHYAVAYYDEKKHFLVRSALTLNGFNALSETLMAAGITIENQVDIHVSIGMIDTMQNILQKKLDIFKYEALFEKKSTKDETDDIAKMNHFLSLTLPYMNQGKTKEMDIEALAKEAGVDIDSAKEMMKTIMKKVNKK